MAESRARLNLPRAFFHRRLMHADLPHNAPQTMIRRHSESCSTQRASSHFIHEFEEADLHVERLT
jgi:hypothetical protein